MKKYAVLIGNGLFPNEPDKKTWADLHCPKNDIEGLEKLLINPEKGEFLPENVHVLLDKTSNEIMAAIYAVFEKVTMDDLLLIYYSGHGVQVGRSPATLYLAAHNTVFNDAFLTAVPVARFRELMNIKSSIKKIILILDCCYSGDAGQHFAHKGDNREVEEAELAKQLAENAKGIYLLAAAGSTVALEREHYSLFTKYLIEALETGDADTKPDGFIDIHQLFNYIRPRVEKEEPKQQPRFYGIAETGGRLIISKSGRDSRKDRAEKIRLLLLKFEEQHEHIAGLKAEALAIARTDKAKLPTVQSKKDQLLTDLLDKKIPFITFVIAWAELAAESATEKAEQEKIKQEQLARDKEAQEKAATEKVEQEKIKQEQLARDKEAQETAAREKAEQEKIKQEQLARDKEAQEKAAREKAEQEKIKQERLARNKEAQEKAAREKGEQQKIKREQQAVIWQSLLRKIASPKIWATLIIVPVVTVATFTHDWQSKPPVTEPTIPTPEKPAMPDPKPSATSALKDETINVKGVDFEMLAIKGDTFQMGSPDTEPERSGDEKQHPVTVSDFQMGKYEVTQKQWTAVMGKDKNPSDNKGDDLPVESVSWDDIQTFISRLNQETEKTGRKFRLPTEAQWEYAARANVQKDTPFYPYDGKGDCITTTYANFNSEYDYNGCGANTKNSEKKTVAVSSYQPNAFGLYNMAGNVWEWTCSAYVEQYDGSETKCISKNDAKMQRVLRGGSWGSEPYNLRSASRYNFTPDARLNFLGFRLSRM